MDDRNIKREMALCRDTKPSAFTLVELLVVIAIIGVLVALLLPAVQAAREAARLNTCKNNIRQLTLANLNHEGSKGRLPAGFTSIEPEIYDPKAKVDVFHTWASYILPYLEQAALFGQIDFTKPAYDPWEQAGRTCPNDAPWVYTQLDVYLCPSDQPRGIHEGFSKCFAHGNYLANQGWWDWWQRTSPTNYNATLEKERNDSGIDKQGPFRKVWTQANIGTELRQITDGLSNTVMLGECRQYPGVDSRGVLFLGSCVYSHEYSPNARKQDLLEWCAGYNGGKDDREGKLYPSAPCSEKKSVGRGPWKQASRSSHSGGVNVSFCDGRVVFIVDDVDINVWRAISTMASEETFNLDL